MSAAGESGLCIVFTQTGTDAAGRYISNMCGRVIQSRGPLRYAIVDGMNVRDSRGPHADARLRGDRDEAAFAKSWRRE